MKPVNETMKLMALQMEKLEDEMKDMKGRSRPQGARFKPGCKACKDSGNGFKCRHCWNCGEDGHVNSYCPEKKKKKLSEVSVEGQTGANVHKSHQCNYCGKEATAKSGIKVMFGVSQCEIL